VLVLKDQPVFCTHNESAIGRVGGRRWASACGRFQLLTAAWI
jgi:hypothetical protein